MRKRQGVASRKREVKVSNPEPATGAAWLSSARVVRCRVKSHNERNPCFQLPAGHAGDSGKTAGVKPEEGGDDVKSSWPLCPGLHTCYNGVYRGKQTRERQPQLRKTHQPPTAIQVSSSIRKCPFFSPNFSCRKSTISRSSRKPSARTRCIQTHEHLIALRSWTSGVPHS